MKPTWFLASFALVLAAWPVVAQPSPIVNGVDLLTPVPPVLVQVAGRSTLVYQMHVTNFQNAEVALVRHQVLRVDRPGEPVADYSEGELTRRLGRPG